MLSLRLLSLALALVACGPAADPEGADSDDTDAGRDSAPVAPDDALG
ncbi:MAG: hypothetical protein H6732_08465, partial [Alphaproteobacteria bacterium]|nr:hypothetical protein [Alphaproteobacteria bacterium]